MWLRISGVFPIIFCLLLSMVQILLKKWYLLRSTKKVPHTNSLKNGFLSEKDQRPKKAGGRVALPPGRFGFTRKILGYGLLKTSLEKMVQTAQYMSRQFKLCRDCPKCVRTVRNVSGQFKMCPEAQNLS